MMLKDLTGQRFGRLVVVGRAASHISPSGQKKVKWNCRCDCGNEVEVIGQNLTRGLTRSCGCYNNEVRSRRSKTHGETNTRLYRIWCGMKRRCNNPHDERFPIYGGRGITVCAEWIESYEAFRDWAIENGYNDQLSIDRKDNDKGYSPDNCRWETPSGQANNRRNTLRVAVDGKEVPLAELARKNGVNYHTLYRRNRGG